MVVDQAWVNRNLGFNPMETAVPADAHAFPPAAHPRRSLDDIQREIIDFDSQSLAGLNFLAFTTATGLSRFTEIDWPAKLAPKTASTPGGDGTGPLPRADVLLATWTVDEGHALSRVLTPGKDSRNDYIPYTHNFATISKKMRAGCPARLAKRLGAYWTTKINDTKVLVFKFDSHLSQDTKTPPKTGQTLPNYDVWKQIIEEVRPRLVITTGTAGGIGKDCEVGDVVVSPIVRFDCLKWLKGATFHDAVFKNGAPNMKFMATAKKLFKANVDRLPPENTRPPKIIRATGPVSSVLTTDFFGFDTSDNRYGLKDLGSVSEMGDAVLGQLAGDITNPPRWLAVRNVSDPQIKAVGTLRDQAALAAQIYKGFGRWSSVCSAIVCWALIAAE
jgi:hypothetical protein